MAVESGDGTELDMVVDEENQENNVDNDKPENLVKVNKEKKDDDRDDSDMNKEENSNSNDNQSKDDEPQTSVVMEVDEVQENDPLGGDNDNESEDRIITASSSKISVNKNENNSTGNDDSGNTIVDNGDNDSAPPPEPVVTEFVKEYSGRVGGRTRRSTSSAVTIDPTKVKIKEEPSEIVVIDSEEEKEEKPKVKVVATRNMQLRQNPKANTRLYNSVSNSRNNSDFQIVSVDDDSPMNKNDPMNVFLCSTEEREFRKDYFKDPSSNVLKQRLHCTICDIHIGACPQNSKNMVCHRFLKVLICRKCANFYGQGDFPQDEGSDEFCRWCGEGGEVFLCNSCSNVFCQACILRNFGMGEVKRVDRLENWDCYVCDTRPLWTLRAIAFALFTYVRRIKVVAYRNGMYQTINSSNAKVSKSDLMALETDLSTCCPKEVKAAAAAASAPSPNETEKQSASADRSLKPKENKITNQVSSVRTPPNKPSPQNKPSDGSKQFMSNNMYNQQQSPAPAPTQLPTRSASKRSKQSKQIAPQSTWQQPQPQMLPEFYPGPGKRVPNQPPFPMSQPPVMYPQQSTLRTALVGQQQPGFVPSQQMVPNSFGQNPMMMYSGAPPPPVGKDGEPNVLHWFNGILVSLMDTMKNIDNRLVFIRNSMTNLISQNEVSFLVNQLHNLLKVSCSKMQEVDCDLLKNYKEFIDKSEISVNDFDDIVREFPEFFKPSENNNEEPPENNETDPEPPDDINPMALVEVIEEGDQPSQSGDSKQASSGSEKNSAAASPASNTTPSTSKNTSVVQPGVLTIKKELIAHEDTAGGLTNNSCDVTLKPSENHRKRKSNAYDKSKSSKVQLLENIRIKKEIEEVEDNHEDGNLTDVGKSSNSKKSSLSLENVIANLSSEKNT